VSAGSVRDVVERANEPPRRVLVTGAGRGIGRATAVRLASAGARVLGVSRTESELESLARAAPIEVLAASIAERAGCRHVAGEAEARLGGVDVLIHCAGVDTHRERPIWEQDEDVWDDTIAVNAYAPFELTRLLAGAMTARRWGRIVMVASTAGAAGGPASSAYCAAKHAVVGLMRAVAVDVAPYGVTCNAVLPGWVRDTGMSERTMQLTAERERITPEEAWARIEAASPAGRVVYPDEVAATIAFLVSEDAGAINGEAVRIALGSLW
jgi:NAD(P)-dependent dehydrogenase (short-subunit alcohol dehydrogenase family)